MTPLETLNALLCDPSGKCCIRGSDEDRRLIDEALASHGQAPAVGTIGHVGDGKTTLTAAIASLLAPTPQADSQPAPVRDYPPLPQGWPARFRCDSCDGNGEVGEPMYMGHFQPPERARCPDCDGRGWCSEEAAFSADHMRAYVDADRAARAPAGSVLEDAARLTSEQEYAIRQGHEIAASDGYFDARPQIESKDRRKVFQAGFERGWDAARKQGANHD